MVATGGVFTSTRNTQYGGTITGLPELPVCTDTALWLVGLLAALGLDPATNVSGNVPAAALPFIRIVT
jgi:hypothetical protein